MFVFFERRLEVVFLMSVVQNRALGLEMVELTRHLVVVKSAVVVLLSPG